MKVDRGVDFQTIAETGDRRRRPFVPAYTVVLAANGLLILLSSPALFTLARDPRLEAARWVFEFSAQAALLIAVAVGLVVFLRVRRSELAPTATSILSVFLFMYVPLGTASFIYWMVSVRSREKEMTSQPAAAADVGVGSRSETGSGALRPGG